MNNAHSVSSDTVTPTSTLTGLGASFRFVLIALLFANVCAPPHFVRADCEFGNSPVAREALLNADDFIRIAPADSRLLRGWKIPIRLTDEPAGPINRTTVDVMVLYTGAAKARLGEEAIRSKIALGFAYLNEACSRSGVNARFRLVYQGETTWHNECPNSGSELNWLSTDEKVDDLRQQFGADLVSLFVRDGFPNGGLGELPGCFSVFNGSAFVFAHECGHNLGLDHDRPFSTCPTRDDCNFGYSFIPPGTHDVYGTIMSYVGSQIEQFSNPDKYFMGAPTGLRLDHCNNQGDPDAADNAAFLNARIPYVALSEPTRVTLLESPMLSDDPPQFSFLISGPDAGQCTVEYTSDYRTWTTLTNIVLAGDDLEITDIIGGTPWRFYRAVLATNLVGTQVGFVKKVVPVGWSMIANPLETPNNTIASLFPELPDGIQFFKWMEGQRTFACNMFGLGSWDDPDMTLHPGEGIIMRNSSGSPLTLRFVGEVNQAMHNRLPLGLCVRSAAIPLAGGLTSALRLLPFGPGAELFRLDPATGQYDVYEWDGEAWSPEEPVLEMSEAFWCRNPINAFVWERILWTW